MAVAPVVLRPTAATSSIWTLTGAASLALALSDNSDASYGQLVAGAMDSLLITGFGSFSVPPLAQIRSITARVRWAPIAGFPSNWGAQIVRQGAGSVVYFGAGPPTPYGTITTSTLGAITTGSTGGPLSQGDVDSLQLYLYPLASAHTHRVHEAYLDLLYNEAPVVVVTSPASPVVDTTRPSWTWTYTDPESDAQEAYRTRLFTAAQVAVLGFDPATSPAAWDSGEVFSSSARTVASGIDLVTGTTYTPYLAARDAGSNGRYSAWAAGAAFLVTLAVPAVPAVVATAEPTAARVRLDATGFDNILTRNQSMVETGTIGFVAVTNAGTLTRDTAQFRQGLASLRFQSVAGGDMKVGTLTGTNGVPVAPGQVVTGLVSIRPASNRAVRAELAFYDAAGAQIGTNTLGASVSPGAGVWSDRSVTATAPALTVTAAVIPAVLATGGAAEQAWADQFSVAPGTSTVWTRGGFVTDLGRLADTFTRADSAVTLGSSEGPGTPAWAALSGTWGITAGRAYLVSTTIQAVAVLTSTHLTDGYVEADVTLSATANRADCGLIFRASDNSNYLMLAINKTGTGTTDALTVYKQIAGAFTSLGQLASVGFVNGQTYRIRVEFYGAAIRVLVGGVARLTVVLSAADLAATGSWNRHGIRINATGAGDDGGSRFDNFVAGSPKTQVVTVQRSTDVGVTWANVREAYTETLTDPLQSGLWYDNEAPRAIALQYRARAEAIEGTGSLASAWSTPVAVTLAGDGHAWLKSPTNTTLNQTINDTAGLASESPDDSSVLYAEGRRTPIIYTGPIRGEVFTIPLFFANDAAWLAFEALRARGEALLFQTCYGDTGGLEQYWVRLGKRTLARITTDAMHTAQGRTADVAAWEVAVPTVT
jgi:hypothetical protein